MEHGEPGAAEMKLILVRHPQPQVEAGVCYGRSDLAPQAEHLRQVLAELAATLPPDLPLYSSPLRRCAELAVLLGRPQFDARLAEMDFGDWEMRRWDDIPRAAVDAWNADLAGYRPGGGESLRQAAARVAAFYDERRQERRDAVVICHAGTMRLLAARNEAMTLDRPDAPDDMALRAARTAHAIGYGQRLVLTLPAVSRSQR